MLTPGDFVHSKANPSETGEVCFVSSTGNYCRVLMDDDELRIYFITELEKEEK